MADQTTSIIITAQDRASAALTSVGKTLGGLNSSVTALIPQFGALTGSLSVGAFVTFAKASIDAMAALDDMAEKTGASVESLSALADVAKIGGHEMSVVESGMVRLTKALAGGDDEAKAAGHALEALGLKAEELRRMDTGQAMLEVAKALDQYADSGGKTALILDLLGRNGAALLPFMKDLAEKGALNAKVTAEQAAQAEKLQKSWNGLKVAADDAGRSMAISLMPVMERLAQAASGGVIEGFISRWGASFKGLAAGINEAMASAEEFLGKITFGKVSENHYRQAIEYRERAKAIYAELSALAPVVAPPGEAKKDISGYAPAAGAGGKAGKTGKTDLERLRQKYIEMADPLQKYREQLDQINQLREAGKLTADQAIEAEWAVNEAMDAIAKNAELSAKAAQKESDEIEKLRQKYIEMADPLQKYREQLDQINQLREAGKLTADQAIEAEWAVNEAMDAQIAKMNDLADATKKQKDIARELGMTFSSAFEDAIIGGKKFSDVLKGLSDDIARIIIRKKITEPFAEGISKMVSGFDFGKLFGFASGGSFTVGGSGGTDSQLVAFRATPGEEVSVRTPAQQGGGVTVVQNINIDSRSDQATIMVAMAQARNAAIRAIAESQRRGGAFA